MNAVLKLPQKQSLEQQTAAILREMIATKTWTEWLPGERALCDMLQVSRHTLRGGLRQLRDEGIVASAAGLGNRIASVPSLPPKTAEVTLEVGLLVGGEIEMLVPSQVTWIDQLRAMLTERGHRLHVFSGRKYAQPDPHRALRQLMAQHPHRCWILLLTSAALQAWFQENRVPCVVAGSLYPGIALPFCDVDHHASCRHAAGVFLGRGHRHLALIVQKSQRAGDVESASGFIEGARPSGADVVVGYHEATAASIAATVRRLMHRAPAPTAILAVNSFHFLATLSSLAQLGHRVPDDVSVISRDGEHYLSYILPAPAHYAVAPRTFAKTLFAQVLQLLETGTTTRRAAQIMPDFFPGQTVKTLT